MLFGMHQLLALMPHTNLHTRMCQLADMLDVTVFASTGAWSEKRVGQRAYFQLTLCVLYVVVLLAICYSAETFLHCCFV